MARKPTLEQFRAAVSEMRDAQQRVARKVNSRQAYIAAKAWEERVDEHLKALQP